MDGMWTQQEIDERIFELYDEYCHGRIDRRTFLQRSRFVASGVKRLLLRIVKDIWHVVGVERLPHL